MKPLKRLTNSGPISFFWMFRCGMNGFDVLDEIDCDPHVIFTTAYDQYAIKAFEKNAVDYLLKPLDEERFRRAVNRALKRKTTETRQPGRPVESVKSGGKDFETHIFVQKSEKLFNLPVEEIILPRGIRGLYGYYYPHRSVCQLFGNRKAWRDYGSDVHSRPPVIHY